MVNLDTNSFPCPDDVTENQYSKLKIVVRYVHEHYHEGAMRLDVVAYQADMSPSHCSRIFKKVMGQTYLNYVHNLRIAAAIGLLQNSAFSITDIGGQVGFNDFTNFCRTFRKVMGQTPSQYRKIARSRS